MFAGGGGFLNSTTTIPLVLLLFSLGSEGIPSEYKLKLFPAKSKDLQAMKPNQI